MSLFLPVSLPVKEVWKSVNIWGSYGQEFSVLFVLRHSVQATFVRWSEISIISSTDEKTFTLAEPEDGRMTNCLPAMLFIDYARTVCTAGFMKLSSVRPSVCLSVCPSVPSIASLHAARRVCCVQEISIYCCTAGAQLQQIRAVCHVISWRSKLNTDGV